MAKTPKRAARKSQAPDVVFGEHRSLALAERHARELSREHGIDYVIVARRRADGRYSERGHHFEFQPEKPKIFEWLVTFSYESTGRSFDVIVTSETENDAVNQAKKFLRKDTNGIKVLKSLSLWAVVPARGIIVDQPHAPQYRDESEDSEQEIGEDSL